MADMVIRFGRYGLFMWPMWLWPIWFVADMVQTPTDALVGHRWAYGEICVLLTH